VIRSDIERNGVLHVEERYRVAAKAQRVDSREEQERVAGTVARFLRSRAKLDELIASSASAGRIPFEEINSFVENELFELKEECHSLFRNEERQDETDLTSGGLFDILVGSLFHQMMKVKENTYQSERYAPRYAALRRAARGPNPPEHAEAFLREGQRIIQRARRALGQDLAHAVELFSEATVVLRHVLLENSGNPLLVRTLLDNQEVVEAVYGPRSLDKLLREMYDGHPAAGYVLAASDLYEGGWYDRARELCKQARKLDAKNKHAAQLLRKINAAARAHLS
jgi:hypothetical protein